MTQHVSITEAPVREGFVDEAAPTVPFRSPLPQLPVGSPWIDFTRTSNPLGTPPSFIAAMRDALITGDSETESHLGARELKASLASVLDLPSGCFCCGGSGTGMIATVARAFDPCTVGVSVPGPLDYSRAVESAHHEPVHIANPFSFVVPDPETALAHGITFDAAVLANPAYPTSRLLPRNTLLRYLESCKWVVVDERSIELTLCGESMADLVLDHPNLIVIRSLNKAFALSVPICYCIAHPDTAARIERCNTDGSSLLFANALSACFVTEQSHLDEARALLDTEIPWLQCMLNLTPGVRVFPAEANYVMGTFKPDEGMRLNVQNTSQLVSALQARGILIRKLRGMNGLEDEEYFCIAVHTREDNARLISELRAIVSS